MTGKLPCQDPDAHDLWFSDDEAEQQEAAKRCQDCPLTRYTQCREDGWDNEYGVWGGLSARMRRRLDKKRYERAVADAKLMSIELDETVARINTLLEIRRLQARRKPQAKRLPPEELARRDAAGSPYRAAPATS